MLHELERHAECARVPGTNLGVGRNTQGVRLIRLDDGERLIGRRARRTGERRERDGEEEGADASSADAGPPARAVQPGLTGPSVPPG